MEDEEFRPVGTRNVFSQAADSAPGYPDQTYLYRKLVTRSKAETPSETRQQAREELARISLRYGSKDLAVYIDPSLKYSAEKD